MSDMSKLVKRIRKDWESGSLKGNYDTPFGNVTAGIAGMGNDEHVHLDVQLPKEVFVSTDENHHCQMWGLDIYR